MFIYSDPTSTPIRLFYLKWSMSFFLSWGNIALKINTWKNRNHVVSKGSFGQHTKNSLKVILVKRETHRLKSGYAISFLTENPFLCNDSIAISKVCMYSKPMKVAKPPRYWYHWHSHGKISCLKRREEEMLGCLYVCLFVCFFLKKSLEKI